MERLVLALALLTTPPQELPEWYVLTMWDCHEEIVVMSIHMEVLDRRERFHLFRNPPDFYSDLACVQSTYQYLKDAPYVSDVTRLPLREVIVEDRSFARAYITYLETRQALELQRGWYFSDTINETNRLMAITDLMLDAAHEGYFIQMRRRNLAELRRRIGPEDYYNGNWPHSVPLDRFYVIQP